MKITEYGLTFYPVSKIMFFRTTENVGSLKIEGGAGDRAKNRHLGRQNVCKGRLKQWI